MVRIRTICFNIKMSFVLLAVFFLYRCPFYRVPCHGSFIAYRYLKKSGFTGIISASEREIARSTGEVLRDMTPCRRELFGRRRILEDLYLQGGRNWGKSYLPDVCGQTIAFTRVICIQSR